MRIAHIFHSIDELENRIGLRFKQRLDALLDAYNQKRYIILKETQIRAACVAWAFLQLSLDGNQTMAADFHYMLHGERLEHIEYDNITIYYNDETGTEEVLMWDIACLMLEEYVLELPQFAFDIADRHVYLAYTLPQQPTLDVEPEQPATAAQQPTPIKEDVPKQEIQATTRRETVTQATSQAPDSQLKQPFAAASDSAQGLQTAPSSRTDITEIRRLMEYYAKLNKDELVMLNVVKDIQKNDLKNIIDKLLAAQSARDINNFYQGDIRTQINGGDIDMKNQT